MKLETTQAHIHDRLSKKAALGDRRAQTELYELYCDAMFKVANRIVNDVACAEDLMHEAFIDAFQKLDKFQFDSTFGHWLKRIVINKCLNHLRREKMISEKVEELRQISMAENIESEVDNSDDWSIKFSLSSIYEASQQLAKNHALVFNLYMIEGYDHEEISEIMGISASTSRSQLSRAKQNLKKILIHQMRKEDVRS